MGRARRKPGNGHSKTVTAAKHVLVVDDDVETREAFRVLLTQAGMDVVAAASVPEAMQAARSFAPTVVLSDLAMPGEDGFSLVRRLRALERHTGRHATAIAVTGLHDPAIRRQAISAGFDACLLKPVAPATIVNAVARAGH